MFLHLPFVTGVHGTAEDCLVKYDSHLHATRLVADIVELFGKDLLCECPLGTPCVADVLIAEAYQRFLDDAAGGRREVSAVSDSARWATRPRGADLVVAGGATASVLAKAT